MPEIQNRAEVEQKVLAHLKLVAQEQLNLSPEQISQIEPDKPLQESLQLDSLGAVVLISSVEREFGYTFEPEQWQELTSVKDMVTMITDRVCGVTAEVAAPPEPKA